MRFASIPAYRQDPLRSSFAPENVTKDISTLRFNLVDLVSKIADVARFACERRMEQNRPRRTTGPSRFLPKLEPCNHGEGSWFRSSLYFQDWNLATTGTGLGSGLPSAPEEEADRPFYVPNKLPDVRFGHPPVSGCFGL